MFIGSYNKAQRDGVRDHCENRTFVFSCPVADKAPKRLPLPYEQRNPGIGNRRTAEISEG